MKKPTAKYRVARVNSFGVIDARTSPMPRREAKAFADRNNALVAAEGRGDSTVYVVVADSPWDITEIASALAAAGEKT